MPVEGEQPYLGASFVLRAYSDQERIVDAVLSTPADASAQLERLFSTARRRLRAGPLSHLRLLRPARRTAALEFHFQRQPDQRARERGTAARLSLKQLAGG
ncbi:hypothetical protein LP420_16400 [Massilia sp. B-10]|nr:hypothetical protein LP420_16400 [Massilia sp. B-10]